MRVSLLLSLLSVAFILPVDAAQVKPIGADVIRVDLTHEEVTKLAAGANSIPAIGPVLGELLISIDAAGGNKGVSIFRGLVTGIGITLPIDGADALQNVVGGALDQIRNDPAKALFFANPGAILPAVGVDKLLGLFRSEKPRGRLEANYTLNREGEPGWEQFRIVQLGTPPGNSGDNWIAILAHTGWLCHEPGGRVIADRPARAEWECWQFERHGDGRVSLKSIHGQYLTADNGGFGGTSATSATAGEYERFTIESAGNGNVRFRCFKSARPDLPYYLNARIGN